MIGARGVRTFFRRPMAWKMVVSQMATVDRGRLLEKVGTLNKELQKEVMNGCRWVIADGTL